jgi:hypothetical protein
VKKLLFIALLILSVSCSPMGSIRPGEGTTFQITGRDYDEIWEAVIAVIDDHLFMVAQDKAMGTIKAEGREGVITGGDVVSLYIIPPRPGKARYTIEVVSLTQAATPITEPHWESKIVTEIKFKLGV